MAFQIINSNKEPVSLNQLDNEAAAFWGKQVKDKEYATPTKVTDDMTSWQKAMAETSGKYNWFYIIGFQISNPKTNYTSGWNNVKACLWVVQTTHHYEYVNDLEELAIHAEVVIKFLRPYFDLIDHWASKGYEPRTVAD